MELSPCDLKILATDDPLRINSISLSAIVHSTEDPEKVWKALLNVSPREKFSSTTEERKFKGHYGNDIRFLKLLLRHSQAEELFLSLWNRLAATDQESILDSIGAHVDSERDLHLRLDKEDCFKGVLRLQDREPLKVQISFMTKPASSLSSHIDRLKKKLGSPA